MQVQVNYYDLFFTCLQEVECVVTDGPLVVSSCLGGVVRVWDSTSGENLTCINRKK